MNAPVSELDDRTVLVADDDPIIRELLATMLRADGLQVVGEAWNCARAVELYRKLRPDVVCLDVAMPGQDGIEALAAIRAIDPAAVVLVISAETTAHNVQRAREAGANGIIAKPLNAQRLSAEIRRALFQGVKSGAQPGNPG